MIGVLGYSISSLAGSGRDASEEAGGPTFVIGVIKLEWDPDVQFWFNSVEASMRRATVNKQWMP